MARYGKSCAKNSQERHAPAKEGNVALGQRRKRWQGEKPQTGHRHRPFRGSEERREGPKKKIELTALARRLASRIRLYSALWCCSSSSRLTTSAAKREQHVARHRAKARIAGHHEHHSARDHRPADVQRTAFRGHPIDSVKRARCIEIPNNLAVRR